VTTTPNLRNSKGQKRLERSKEIAGHFIRNVLTPFSATFQVNIKEECFNGLSQSGPFLFE
jgi:hypothetical protein